jgi:hypothetical protein
LLFFYLCIYLILNYWWLALSNFVSPLVNVGSTF